MDAAEDDDVGCSLLRFLRQREAVSHIVGEFLYLVSLLVMSQDDGVLFFLQSQDFLLELLIIHIHLMRNLNLQKYTKKSKKRYPDKKNLYFFILIFIFSFGCLFGE